MSAWTQPDFRTRQVDGQWLVEAWAGNGWELLPGTWPTKRAAVESTDPSLTFCHAHWSWLCGVNHPSPRSR